MRTCENCAKRKWMWWDAFEYCMDYEMTDDPVACANDCERYELESETDDETYTPSATARDYGPSNPWDAPGMSIRDFL